MERTEEKAYERFKKDVAFDNADFSLDKLSHKEAHAKVYAFLKSVVVNTGCYDYIFIYAITKLEERHGKFMQPYLVEILDNYCNYPELFNRDVAFAAFFNLGVHYYRYSEINQLRELLLGEEYFSLFHKEYPLCYEIASRYCMIKGMFDRQMLLCRCAVLKLEELRKKQPEKFTLTASGYQQTGDNVALKVGYVSSLCSMFEESYVRGELGEELVGKYASASDFDHLSFHKITQLLKKNIQEGEGNYLINDYTIAQSFEYIEGILEYNPSYPKYPFLKAKLLFYATLYRGEQVSVELYQTIESLCEKSKSLENKNANDYELRCSMYDQLVSRVQASMKRRKQAEDKKQRLHYLKLKNEIVRMMECPPPQKRPPVTARKDENYAFVSYSTKDFKSVYCDLLEMERRGISYWYDAKVIPGEEWYKVIENRVKGASCIICFLSANFLMSGAVLHELTLFKKYEKPIIWVDLTGKKQISQIIIGVIKNANKAALSKMSSGMMNVLTSLLNDDVDLIVRDADPFSLIHLNRVENVLEDKFPSLIKKLSAESYSVGGNKTYQKDGKTLTVPNEDYVICDNANRIYMVVDGISRKRDEYAEREGSIAKDVSKLFCEKMHERLLKKLPHCDDLERVQEGLHESFADANRAVKDMLEDRKAEYEGRELPGTVGLVAVIRNNTLCFGCFGDCMGILVRDGVQQIFAQKQTTYPFDFIGVEKDRALLAERYVNVVESPYGYGVVNGQEGATQYFCVSHVELERGDTVYLVSDGVSDFVQFAKPSLFNELPLEEIIRLSEIQDDELHKKEHDDKSVVRIHIAE